MNTQALQDFPDSSLWLNADPTPLGDYRGQAVVLAFVNAASVWCAQRLAELAQWQTRYPGRLRTVVVQVPRFDRERDPTHVLQRLRSQGVNAPILLDRDWETWRRFGVRAWPTLVLLDAQGQEQQRIVGAAGDIDRALSVLCDGQSTLSSDDLPTYPEPRTALRFPAGLVATAERLYIADSGHHRVLECTHAGRVLRRFGTGTADLSDGGAGQAAFRRPQGLALAREALYVADTGNHALRRINLRSGEVTTLCGNGRAGTPAAGTALRPDASPLDHPQGLALVDNQLLIAMAGDNRVWSYHLGRSALDWRAGSGALEIRDGSGHLAAFAQPVALAATQEVVYVCDALGSAIRAMQVPGDLVQTRVGGKDAWAFGDTDGPRGLARLQCPQALALDPDAPLLWIADSGNGRLRCLQLQAGQVSTVALPRPLHGPCGLAAAAGAVWIAETDAHAVLRYDLASGQLSDLPIEE